jgi:DNA invertase Pin-like site-specific DNA recombinase/transposase
MGAIDTVSETLRPTRLRAVAYLRVSTEEQAKGYGIAYTEKKVLRYFEKKGYQHVGTFADEGLSGSLEAHDRPDLKKLMELARQEPRPFDLVGVNEGRSIGRTGRAFWRWVWELEDLGIYVAVAKKDYDNSTPGGRSQMRKDADYAEEERELIRDRTQGGIQEKAEEGLHAGGVAPYGYRIADKGIKGVSHLVPDECPNPSHCDATHESGTLRLMWHLAVIDGKNCRQVALYLNAEGFRTRYGKPWTAQTVNRTLKSRPVQESRIIYRNPETAGRSNGTKIGPDGSPVYGDTVTITLEPVFTEAELKRLNKALARNARTRNEAKHHPLSERIFGACGKHYTGCYKEDRDQRLYRCSGKVEKFAGAPRCSCSQIEAEPLEARVWKEVTDLLGDADRLTAMAQDWLDVTGDQRVNHAGRIAGLDEKIQAQDKAIAAVMVVAAQSGQSPEAITLATKALQEERANLVKLKAEAEQWQVEAQQAQERAHDLQALAELARTRLHELDVAERAEVLDLLDIRVTLKGGIPKRVRKDDTLTTFFRKRGQGVPVLDDAAWEAVRALFEGSEVRKRQNRLPHRKVLEAVLLKARTGLPWAELPEEYGKTTGITTRYQRWLASGLFERAMDALRDLPESALPAVSPLPELLVEGRVDPRLLIGVRATPQEPVPSGTMSSGVIHFRMVLAA